MLVFSWNIFWQIALCSNALVTLNCCLASLLCCILCLGYMTKQDISDDNAIQNLLNIWVLDYEFSDSESVSYRWHCPLLLSCMQAESVGQLLSSFYCHFNWYLLRINYTTWMPLGFCDYNGYNVKPSQWFFVENYVNSLLHLNTKQKTHK